MTQLFHYHQSFGVDHFWDDPLFVEPVGLWCNPDDDDRKHSFVQWGVAIRTLLGLETWDLVRAKIVPHEFGHHALLGPPGFLDSSDGLCPGYLPADPPPNPAFQKAASIMDMDCAYQTAEVHWLSLAEVRIIRRAYVMK